jgi:hypothetical protein
MFEPRVLARLPRGGLGNKLLVWARALVFAYQHGLPLSVSGWAEFRIGPYLRGERSKRQYWGYFSNEDNPGLIELIALACAYSPCVEPDMHQVRSPVMPRQVFVFDQVPSWRDYFDGLRGHESLVRPAFAALLNEPYRGVLQEPDVPVVGVHVRRSDFRELSPGECFGQNCNVRTPIGYYVDVINSLRHIRGEALPVTVFTDGREEDVRALLALPAVRMAAPANDIVDLLRLSRSRCIVASAGSTFSYWAAYLSDAPVITHHAHPVAIRSDMLRQRAYEGPLMADNECNALLVRNLMDIGDSQIDAVAGSDSGSP